MEIITILSAHKDTELVQNTINSIIEHVGNNVLTVIDGAAWNNWGKDAELTTHKLQGFYHNHTSSPYKNVALGLMTAAKEYNNADWFCYTEYDTYFVSNLFKNSLSLLDDNIWCAGNDLRSATGPFVSNYRMPTNINWLEPINKLANVKIKYNKYLLGCCVFYRSELIYHLNDINFFEKFINFTHVFEKGYFPGYKEYGGYDLSEHLYPTITHALGKKNYQFAKWNGKSWSGNYKNFTMRWQPEILESELYKEASIFHPIKSINHPARRIYDNRRTSV